jgi:hypothetical protein
VTNKANNIASLLLLMLTRKFFSFFQVFCLALFGVKDPSCGRQWRISKKFKSAIELSYADKVHQIISEFLK